MNKKTIFIAAGPFEWGSSRMRAWWIVGDQLNQKRNWYVREYKDFAQEWQAIDGKNFDSYVWQKYVNIDFIKDTKDKNHYWDICDPMWWFSPDDAKAIAESVDGIVFSSEALKEDCHRWALDNAVDIPDLYIIQDRLDMSHFPIKKQHVDTDNIRFIWFGVAVNRQALYAALANLERLKANGYNISLTIFDDRPDIQFTGTSFPVYHTRWNLENENEIIASHDIALLPPYPGPWGKVKSNNKTLTAWACGIPVTDGQEYSSIEDLVNDNLLREVFADAGMMTLKREYTIGKSAAQWEEILC